MVSVLLSTGMRIGELLNTTLSDAAWPSNASRSLRAGRIEWAALVYLADDACQGTEHCLVVRRWKTESTSVARAAAR